MAERRPGFALVSASSTAVPAKRGAIPMRTMASPSTSVGRHWRTVLPGPGLAIACVALAGCSGEPVAPTEPPVRPAKLMVVAASESTRTINLPAVIDATATADLAFQVSGLLLSVSVLEGQTIAEGTEIARLDQRDLRNDLATAQANHEAASGNFQRGERLVEQDAISRAEYDELKTRRDVAQAALDAAAKKLDDSVLRSPFAGVVADLHVEAHQNVTAQQAVATLQTTGAATAVVQAPATLMANSGRLEPLRTEVVLDAAPEQPIAATLHSYATRADPSARTFEVRFAFSPPPELVILPGMTGTVRSTVAVVGEGDAMAVSVPLEAILSEADARYVWVVDAEAMTVSKRAVTLGAGVGDTLPVLDGLQAGETIVAAGVSQLHEGMRVRPYAP